MRPWTDRQTHRQTYTQTRVTTIHFASSTTHAKCNKCLKAKSKSTQQQLQLFRTDVFRHTQDLWRDLNSSFIRTVPGRIERVRQSALLPVTLTNVDWILTRHRASTSMYSLTFCVRVMLPERHQWKPAVQAAAVMLRTPPVDGQSPASSARRPRPDGRSHYVVISRDGRKLVTRVRIMLP